MPYIQRRNGQIIGLFENQQPGMAEEWLAADDVEVLAFRDRILQQPNWRLFRVSMMTHPAYRRIASSANLNRPMEVQQLQIAISMPDPYLPVIRDLWEVLLTTISPEDQPGSQEIAEWNAIAASAHLPFTFDSQGLIELIQA